MGQGQSNEPESQPSGCLNLCVSRRYYMKKQIQRKIEQYNRQPLQLHNYESEKKNKNKIQNVKSLPKYNIHYEKYKEKYSDQKYKKRKTQQKNNVQKIEMKDNSEKDKMDIDKLSAEIILLGLQSNVVQQLEPQRDIQNYYIQGDQRNPTKINANNNGTHITGQGLGITNNQHEEEVGSQNEKHSMYQNSLSSNKFSISLNSNKQLLVNKIQSLKKKYIKNDAQTEIQKERTNNNNNNTPTKEQKLDIVQDKIMNTTQVKKQMDKVAQPSTCEKSIKLQKEKKQLNQISKLKQSQNSSNKKQITYKSSDKNEIVNQNIKLQKQSKEIMEKSSSKSSQQKYFNKVSIKDQTINRNQITEIVQFFSESSSGSSSNDSTVQNDEFFFTSQHVFGNKINLAKKPLQVKQNQICFRNNNPIKSISNENQKNRVNVTQSVKTQNKNCIQSQNVSRGSRKVTSLNCTKLITF